MGTSNWQNISYCVDKIVKLQPKSILDVGVGFGRWAFLAREFLEVWHDRTQRNQWVTRIDGIEAFEPQIKDYHSHFYDQILIGDAHDLIPTAGDYDLILLGDVLEHFTPERASAVLRNCKAQARHVMLNIPLGDCWMQGEKYDNPFEAHLSAWEDAQLSTGDLLAKELFTDFSGRPFGVYIYEGGNRDAAPPQAKRISLPKAPAETSPVDELCAYFGRHPNRARVLLRFIDLLRR